MARNNSLAGTTYQMPLKAIADLADAPLTPDISVSPSQDWLLLMEQPPLPPISELAQPELKLAGLRINPRNNGPSRGSYVTGLSLKSLTDNSEKPITGLPPDARIGNVSWSPDSKFIAFTNNCDSEIQLWVVEIRSGCAKCLDNARLSSAYGKPFHWFSDSKNLVCKVVPSDRAPVPEEPQAPDGPVIRENTGQKAPARTYQDLLKNPYDEVLFEHYLTTQIMIINIGGEGAVIGPKGIIGQMDPSPNGQYILVETIHTPFSYLVPIGRFPRSLEIWDMNGKVICEIADLPLADKIPIDFDGVATGPRSLSWRADAPGTVYWAEAQDEGDPKVEADIRDKMFMLPQPFDQKPIALASLGFRFSSIRWSDNNIALVSERWWKTRRTRTWIVKPDSPSEEAQILFDRSSEDSYSDPGDPLTRPADTGMWTLITAGDGNTIFLSGAGASPEGNRPFLDRMDLTTRETERLWQSEAPYYESLYRLLDEKEMKLLTRRESKSDPPNYFIRALGEDEIRQITDFPHPAPQLAEVQKELIQYERDDGVKLTATLYLPPGYSPDDGALPMLMWAYPREFKSADAASQVTDSPYRFVRIYPHSPLFWLVQGYAILDGVAMPIIGEEDEEPNDTYVDQLVSSAKAAIDEVVRREVADRKRIAVGGHSYGAFMTANLLVHSDLFAAGIARSGAYNRTLTPFGFQSEERTLWEAPEVYFGMSPFMHAQKVKAPILLIHGAADNNSGTFTVQSERFYHALKGHGANVRLVLLPHESHGYRGRESVMHMLWEMDQWLSEHVAK